MLFSSKNRNNMHRDLRRWVAWFYGDNGHAEDGDDVQEDADDY